MHHVSDELHNTLDHLHRAVTLYITPRASCTIPPASVTASDVKNRMQNSSETVSGGKIMMHKNKKTVQDDKRMVQNVRALMQSCKTSDAERSSAMHNE